QRALAGSTRPAQADDRRAWAGRRSSAIRSTTARARRTRRSRRRCPFGAPGRSRAARCRNRRPRPGRPRGISRPPWRTTVPIAAVDTEAASLHDRAMVRDLPAGVVTFLFSDVERSTRLLHELGDDYGEALNEHRRRLRAVFDDHEGIEVDTQGDAFFVAFARASNAAAAATDGQRALADGPIRVR